MATKQNWEQTIQAEAKQVTQLLQNQQLRIVFAESCTAGLLAATFGQIPGISETLCGSAVTYRNATKAGWLGVDQKMLDNPEITAVSEPVAQQMAAGVLQMTPEANIAVSVTGHLGPGAPEEKDGLVYFAIIPAVQNEEEVVLRRIFLPTFYPEQPEIPLRVARQQDVISNIIQELKSFLQE